MHSDLKGDKGTLQGSRGARLDRVPLPRGAWQQAEDERAAPLTAL